MQFSRRNGLLSALFATLTCGLYSIYFWLRYGHDVNIICADDGKETPNYIVAWLLSLITCGVYGMYWTYMLASRLDTASKKYDVNVESPVLFTLFMNIPFLSYFYACDVMNKFQEKYEQMYPMGSSPNGSRPTPPAGGSSFQNMGAEIGSQFKSVVQDVGNSIKTSAQNAMPSCPNCGAILAPGKNYCKKCGFPVNATPSDSWKPAGPTSADSSTGGSQPIFPSNEAPSVDLTDSPKPSEAAPVCPKCGHPIKPGDRFCIHCGGKID